MIKGQFKSLYFEHETPLQIAEQLNRAWEQHLRIKITYKKGFGGLYGYSKILEEVFCYVGRSTGNKKIPLEIMNNRSIGGGVLLTHCIKRIEYV